MALSPVVQRWDVGSGKVRKVRKNGIGGWVVDAYATRTGVFKYQQPDGSIIRELRLPEEVFREEALKSLDNVPATDDHPRAGKVSTTNWSDLAIGHVSEPKQDDRFLAVEVHLNDQSAIDKADAGRLQELSCGYDCRLEDAAPGASYEGEPYDKIQRDIRYNHVALGPEGWGRAGNEVRLHLDAGASVSGAPYVSSVTPEEAAALKAENDRLKGELTTVKDSLSSEKTKVGELGATVKTLESQVKTLTDESTKRSKNDSDKAFQERVDAAVTARLELVERVAAFMPPVEERGKRLPWRADGKTNLDIMREVIAEQDAEIETEKWTENEVARSYELAARFLERRADAGRHSDRAQPTVGNVRGGSGRRDGKGGDDDPDPEKDEIRDARQKMMDRQKNLYKDSKRRGDAHRRNIDAARERRQAAANQLNAGRSNK